MQLRLTTLTLMLIWAIGCGSEDKSKEPGEPAAMPTGDTPTTPPVKDPSRPSVTPPAVDGQALYLANCVQCHGQDGSGRHGRMSLHQCSYCANLSILSAFIQANMPPRNPGSCNADCANAVGQYILDNFQN